MMNTMVKTIWTVLFMIGINLTALAGQNKFVVPSFVSTHGKAQLPINIENNDEIVAMQFDLTLPEGITPRGEPSLTSRCDDHSVTILSIASRVYRLMLYSNRNRPLKGDSGTVFYLPITISEDIPSESEVSVSVDDPVLSKVTGENVLTELEVGTILVKAIPIPEIVNPGFELSEAVTASLVTSSSLGGVDYETSGWKLAGTKSYSNSGVFAYGSDYKLNNVRVPNNDNNGLAGNALGFTCGWSNSLIYQSSEQVLMPRGTYALLAYVYNANPDAEQMVSKLGFVSSEGQSYLSSVNSYISGEWTIDYVVFTLKTATEGIFQVGCSSRYASPSRNAIPFFDNILLTDEQDLTARMIAVQMAHFPESYGEGKAMASLVNDYNAARQQIAEATNIQDVMASAKTTEQKLTAIKDYISAMDDLAQAIQNVESSKLSQATLTEAYTLQTGLVEGTLYTNDQISQMKSDVNDIISRLNNSVSLYRQLNDALTYLTNVLATPGPDTRVGLADEISSATDLLSTNTTGYEEGTIDDDDVQEICEQVQTVAEELANNIANYVDADEWQILKTVYEQRSEAENWTRVWDFSRGKPWKADLSGVDINDGHVVGFGLNSNNMTGDVPLALLDLPRLQSLNLSGNHLTSLGNAIPVQVTSLKLGNQTMDYVAELSLNDIVTGNMTTKLPSIIQYNHSTQVFDAPLKLNCTSEDGSWSMVVNRQNDGTVNISSMQPYAYKGTNDAMLSVRNSNDGSTFSIRFSFDEGDSNFDGVVNLFDLQATINYAFEDYANKPFNFTAANLWVDELINVQDVVKMVDVLMRMDVSGEEDSSPESQSPARVIYHETPDVKSKLYIKDGYLMLSTDVPVAAFDLMLSGEASVTVSKALKGLGITYSMERQPSGTRIIGYSLSGGVLPEGQTAICKVDAGTTVVHALLSDVEALPIGVAFDSGQATGIVEMKDGRQNIAGEVYDLQGRRVSPQLSRSGANRPIIVIQNGRKVVK